MISRHPYSPDYVLNRLDHCIDSLAENIRGYVCNPLSDFTRKRKITPKILMKFIIQMGAKSLGSEICDFFGSTDNVPGRPAVSMARKKLLSGAFLNVFHLFNASFDLQGTFRNYYLLAADGSDINIPVGHDDGETIIHNNPRSTKTNCQYHMNALYDCINHIYRDVRLTTSAKTREVEALEDMISCRRYPENSIIICDRGYESYNLMTTCIRNGQKFLIRVKDIDVKSGIVHRFSFPNASFDTTANVRITKKQSLRNHVDGQWHYVLLSNTSRFYYLDDSETYLELSFRVVRLEVKEGTYETLVTNLTEDEMPFEDMRDVYHLRWSEECSFRSLKHNIGMIYFHAVGRNQIQQEIYARFILYNFSAIIAYTTEVESHSGCKYTWKPNFAVAVTNIRNYLNGKIDGRRLIELIKKYLVPVRPDRSYERNVRPQTLKPFNDRIS